jgi:peptidoglycan/LPS O-acetylase OafA/YrhL
MGLHKARREILGLDIIRFFSAVLVVGYHFGFIFWFSAAPAGRIMQLPSLAGDQLPAVWFGFVGVQIFFVISGFVISYSAERANAFEFFRDRFVRLAPCLWICATLSLLIHLMFAIDGPIFRSYLKEITFYPFGPWLDIGYLAAFLGGVSLLYQAYSIGSRCGVFGWSGDCSGWQRDWRTAQLTLLDHGCFFAVGVFLWLWLLKERAVSHLWWVLPAVIACVVQIVGCYDHAHRDGHLVGYRGPSSLWVPILVWAGGVLAIVASVRFNAVIRAACGDRIARFIRLIGLSTYPLYLVHFILAGAIVWALYRAGVGLSVAIWSAGFAVVAVSFVIVLFFEPPLKFLLRRLLNQAGAALSASIPRLNFLFVPAAAVVRERPQER